MSRRAPQILTVLTVLAVLAATVRHCLSAASDETGLAAQSAGESVPATVPKYRRPDPVTIAPGVTRLSSGDSFDDYASLAQTSDGTLYVAYAAFYDGHDQVRMHRRLPDGRWSARTYVPLARLHADVWMPQLAVDGDDRVWLVWSEQTGQVEGRAGNWDLYARALDGERWGPLIRLTDDPKPDVNHHVSTDRRGRIIVVWQAHPENSGDIRLRWLDGATWSETVDVTSGPASDWFPQAAVDERGVVWVVFDSYRNRDYDVFLTSVDGDELGPLVPVAASGYYEAHATVACAGSRVWLAWERGGYNWGKDRGAWLEKHGGNVGSTLGGFRTIHVAAYEDGVLWEAPDVRQSLPDAQRSVALAGLATGPDGRLWIRFRAQKRLRRPTDRQALPWGYYKLWTENVSHLEGPGWSPARELPESAGRISVMSRLVVEPSGRVQLAYSADREEVGELQLLHDRVQVATLEAPSDPVKEPVLELLAEPSPGKDARPWDAKEEAAQVAAIRSHRVLIDGKPYRILRGDLHRHSELSRDVGPSYDGSLIDFYRYVIDVADLDFGSLTDHQGERHNVYNWWLTEKTAAMYDLFPRYVPIYGYERSVLFPQGHRNVFHGYRGASVLPLVLQLDRDSLEKPTRVLGNDTLLLYEHLHATDGIAVAHTTADAAMGTDWTDHHDPVVEPVVEIYQGARRSYEVMKGPRADASSKGIVHAGLVQQAWRKGLRLGVVASSDHGSTHVSYAMVLVPDRGTAEPGGQALDAIRARRTYAATDNIIVEAFANGRPMGAELQVAESVEFLLRIIGTAPVARVELLRNGRLIRAFEPGTAKVELREVDTRYRSGTSHYYFRIVQTDGEVAWTSPFWIDFRTEIGGQAATAVSSSKP